MDKKTRTAEVLPAGDPQSLPPIERNDVIEARVVGQGMSGEGIIRAEGFPLFLPWGLPGELVRAKVVKVSKNHGFARLEEILEPSKDRQMPPCPYFGRCGGCDIQHQTYESQLHFKTDRVRDCFTRIGGFKDIDVLPAIGMEHPWSYRNKVQMPIGRENGEIRVGFYKGRSHEIIDIRQCLIQNEAGDLIAQGVREWLETYRIPVLEREDEIKPGAVRHLLIREGRYTGEVMAVLVATSGAIEHLEELKEGLIERVPQLTGLILNINGEVTNRVLGSENQTIWGQDTIIDTIGAIRYRISPHSFFQVNPEQTRRMYEKVIELAELQGTEHVLDLYCGAGSIALYIAGKAGFVTGVEIVPEAVKDADHNKVFNGIQNAEFILGRSEDQISQLMLADKKPDLVIVDPPRKGCDESLLQAIGESNIARMVYVSCDPATLARDAKILHKFGFEPKIIQPFDNFPQTKHCEVLCKFIRTIGEN